MNLSAKTADVDFTVSGSDASVALGLTDTTAHDSNHSSFTTDGRSKSLLDNIVAAGGAIGQQLTIQANGGAVQTITFGQNASAGQVSTLAELNSTLGGLGGVTASVSGSSVHVGVAAGSTATSIKIGGDSTVISQLGLSAYAGETDGTKSAGTASATRSSLQNDFNNVLDQIDALAQDSSYNGINLLNGDDLKVTFNETGSSSLTIKGVNFNSTNLGLNKLNGAQFQDNTQIDTVISAADTGLIDPAHAGLEIRFDPDHGADPSGLHQEYDQHAADGCRQPRSRRLQRGRREHAGPADPPAAFDHGTVACQPGEPGGAAAVRLIAPNKVLATTGGGASAPPLCF